MAASAPSSGLFPELEELRRQFESVEQDSVRLTEGLSEAQFNWRPAPAQWSICECLGHLLITGEAVLGGIDAALDDPVHRPPAGQPPFRYPALQRLIVKLSGPESKSRFKAPRSFRPAHGQPVTAVLPTFRHMQRRFIVQVERANGLDLAAVKVATPITSLYRFCLGMVLAQSAAHARRHLAQAWRVRQHAKFPAGR